MIYFKFLTGMSQIEKRSYDLKAKYVVLESARSMVLVCSWFHFSVIVYLIWDIWCIILTLQLDKNRAEQLQKFYPNLICTQSLGHVRPIILVSFRYWHLCWPLSFNLMFVGVFVCLWCFYPRCSFFLSIIRNAISFYFVLPITMFIA